MLIVTQHLESRLGHPNEPFPANIRNNPWVLYHGTSSNNESAIERHGLLPNHSLFSRADLEAVLTVFRELNWSGLTGASRAALEHFSLNHDFGQKDGKPVFLAESARRAMLFASRDFAGGEMARTVRYSIQELTDYLSCAAVRQQHQAELENDREFLWRHNGLVPPEFDPDLDKLRRSLESLTEVHLRAEQTLAEFRYGIVYAVQFPPEFAKYLNYNRFMGIEVFAPIPPSMLIAKAIVPENFSPILALDRGLPNTPVYRGILIALQDQEGNQAK